MQLVSPYLVMSTHNMTQYCLLLTGLEVLFDTAGQLLGTRIRAYLLETSRVTAITSGEGGVDGYWLYTPCLI